jgi:hypothetical protein
MAEQRATFGAGCFWGVEAAFRRLDGVTRTRVGYAGGQVDNPSYEQVCSDKTGHAEVVEVTYDDEKVPYEQLLAVFWAEQLLVGNLVGVVRDLDDLRVSRVVAADLLVAGVLDLAAGVADARLRDAVDAPERSLDAPETPCSECCLPLHYLSSNFSDAELMQ